MGMVMMTIMMMMMMTAFLRKGFKGEEGGN